MPYVQSVYDQQVALNKLGAGLKTDGIMGPLTQAAISKYASQTNTTAPTIKAGSTYTAGQQVTDQYGTASTIKYDANTGKLLTNANPTTTIPTSTLGTQTALKIPTAPPSNTADVAMAGATAASAQMTTEQKALAAKATADQSSYDKLSGEISSLLGNATGQGQATLDAEAKAGVPQMQQQLQSINGQITTKLAEFKVLQDKYAETQQVVEGKTIPMSLITGKTAELNRSLALQKNTFASEIGLLQAQAQGVQGQLELAKATADRAVDLKYEDIKTQIQVKFQQLDLIRDSLTATERKQAAILERQYQLEDRAIDNLKDTQKQNFSIAQDYAQAALSSGQSQLASKISSLDIFSPTFQQQLSSLIGQIVVPQDTGGGININLGSSGNLSSVTGKPLTEGERVSQGYGARLSASDAIINQFGSQFANTFSLGGLLPNQLQSSDRQQYEQAKRDFINAALRKESGAAIQESEFASAEKQYFPQAGDSAAVIAQKTANRQLKIKALQLEGGQSTTTNTTNVSNSSIDSFLQSLGY